MSSPPPAYTDQQKFGAPYPPQQQQQQQPYPQQQQQPYPPQQMGQPDPYATQFGGYAQPQQQPQMYPQMAGQQGQQQPGVVIVAPVGNCPSCHTGNLVDSFSVCGIIMAILFFPIGLICLFTMMDHRCSHCGYSR